MRSLALMRCRTISTHVDLVVAQARGMARGMAQGQDAAIDQAVRRYFSDALDWGQEFADIFAPEAEVDVDDCIATLEARLALLRRRLAVKDFPSDVQSEASALVGAISPDTLTSRFQALQRAQTGLLRAKIEADRLLLAKLHGDYAQTQIMVTLAALCSALKLKMDDAGDKELARNWERIEAIRRKQASKPAGSPLPQRVESRLHASVSG